MEPQHITLFREMVRAAKGIYRIVWGTGLDGVSAPQFGLLLHLRKSGPLSPSDLSERLLVTQGSLTGLIERMRKLGWVERRRSATDRRVLKIVLTPAGVEKFETVIPLWEAQVKKVMAPLGPTERQDLLGLLNTLNAELYSAYLPNVDDSCQLPFHQISSKSSAHSSAKRSAKNSTRPSPPPSTPVSTKARKKAPPKAAGAVSRRST